MATQSELNSEISRLYQKLSADLREARKVRGLTYAVILALLGAFTGCLMFFVSKVVYFFLPPLVYTVFIDFALTLTGVAHSWTRLWAACVVVRVVIAFLKSSFK